MRRILLFTCFGLFALQSTALDFVVYTQPPAHSGGQGSDGSVLMVADQFQLAQDTLVAEVIWWGGYFNPPPGPDNFTLRLYADNGGQPGAQVSGFTIGSINRVATGAGVNGDFYAEYEYSTRLETPFLAEAGVTYWLSIVNPPRDIWLWESSDSPLNPGDQRSTSEGPWQPYSRNVAFELIAVPEPHDTLLFGAGILSIALAARGRSTRNVVSG